MSILERLYDGKVYPCEEILPQNYAEYRAISGQVGNDYEYFLKELSPEQLKRFEEMDKGMYSELERMGKKNLWGHMELLPEEFKKLLTLAKSGLASQGKVLELQRQLTEAVKGLEIYRTRWQDLKDRTKDYMELERLHPEQTRKALESLKPETSAPTQSPKRKRQQER